MAHKEITEPFRAFMNKLAGELDFAFKRVFGERESFILLHFDNVEKRVNYISNCDRADALDAMKKFIE